jgi:hypothetical protein
MTLVPVISSPKRKNVVLSAFFCSSSGLEPRTVFGVVVFVSKSPLRSKQLWSWRHSSIVLNFRTTGNALTGNRTHDTFSVVLTAIFSSWSQEISLPSLVQIDLSILELLTSKRTQTHNFSFICKVASACFGFKGLRTLFELRNVCSVKRDTGFQRWAVKEKEALLAYLRY